MPFAQGRRGRPGETVHITATVSGANGYLVGWFDWDNDGMFTLDEMVVFGDMVSGTNPLTVRILSGASTVGYFYIRFRLYDRTALTVLSYSGLARGGEVEDYLFRWQPTVVELLSFTAVARPGGTLVAWETASEMDNLYRRRSARSA
ncbi:MAG: GEVED domain-containing protein [Chloroflexia bacterium]